MTVQNNKTPIGDKAPRWLAPAVLAYAAGFVLAAFYDLPLTATLYSPTNLYAILMEAFGWYPAFVPPILLAMLWFTAPRQPGFARWQRALGGFVAMVGLAALYCVSYRYLAGRGLLVDGEDPAAWLWIATAVLASISMVLFVSRFTMDTRLRLAFFAKVGCCYLVIAQVCIYLMKYVWGRVRFDDMLALGSFDLFRPWHLPFGPGGSSFPSGHTANAAGVFVLIVLCDLFPTWRRRRRLVVGLCWGYVAAMALARMLIGRHFLSDTLGASLLMALLFLAVVRNRFYQKGLQATLAKTGDALLPHPQQPYEGD